MSAHHRFAQNLERDFHQTRKNASPQRYSEEKPHATFRLSPKQQIKAMHPPYVGITPAKTAVAQEQMGDAALSKA